MNIYKNLPLKDVNNDDSFVELVFLDDVAHEVHTVKWNKQQFNKNTQKWEDNPEKLQQVEDWCQKEFGVDVANLQKAIDTEHTIYSYPNFDSLWEVASKFDPSMKGEILQADIEKVEATPTSINIWYRYDGELYMSRMRYEKVINGTSYTDATKKNKRFADFKEKFNVTVEEAEDGALKDRTINVEVKTFGKNAYGEIKSLIKKK